MIDISDLSLLLTARVVHVTLANQRTFGFEFLLRSLPCAFSQQLAFLLVLFSAPTTNKVETAVNGCILAFSLDSIVSLSYLVFLEVSALFHCTNS